MRGRQVHLDFHTSEHLTGVGREFDPERFAQTFRDAHVDSVTCFSRCHHGWIYHETDRFPELKHPHLERDLLTEQIRALHAVDIRCPVYVTVGWDERAAREHPEWREVHADGRLEGATPLNAGWKKLDFLSPYLDFVIDQTLDVMDKYGDELDGLFFDIIFTQGVHSVWCLAEYERHGWDPASPEGQAKMRRLAVRTYLERMTEAVRSRRPDLPLFHNAGHVGPGIRPDLDLYSHLELESLPTGGWGYPHFPTVARYARTLDKPFLGMTGKFSESWGHFSSYKAPAALEFECLSSVALGGACSVGDQLPPNGVLDARTYDLIGGVYAGIEATEPWTQGAERVVEVAVLSVEGIGNPDERLNPAMVGAMRALTELGLQFDFVDEVADLSRYRLLILPETSAASAEWVDGFHLAGGAVLLVGDAKLDVSWLPADDAGPLPHSPDFWMDGAGPVVMYDRGRTLAPRENAEVAVTVGVPAFDRTARQFTSHAHAPFDHDSGAPAVVRRDRATSIAHPILTTYGRYSMPLHRDLLAVEIRHLLPDPLVETPGAPRSLQTFLTRQADRHVLHLLHYVPERRGLRQDVVEDRLPLHDLTILLRIAGDKATFEPEGVALETSRSGDVLTVVVPRLDGHGMVVVSGP